MTRSLGEIRSVCGYWFGPPCWFGSANPTPIDIPGLPQDMLAAFRRVLSSGGHAVVSSNGVVLVDFAGLDGPEPAAHEVVAAAFGDDKRRGVASVLALRRVEILNAHQLCLLTAIGTRESEEDVWTPDPRPVHVETLFHGWHDDEIFLPTKVFSELLQFSQPSANSTIQRHLFNVRAETIDRSFDMLEQILNGPAVASRAAHLVLNAADHYRRWRFDQALVAAWSAAEALLAELWARYTKRSAEASATNGYILTSDRQRRLAGPDFTTSIVAEVLALAGEIDQELFDLLATARSARNKWVHGLAPVAHTAASSGVWSAERLFELTTGVHLETTLTLSESGL